MGLWTRLQGFLTQAFDRTESTEVAPRQEGMEQHVEFKSYGTPPSLKAKRAKSDAIFTGKISGLPEVKTSGSDLSVD